MCEGCQGLGGLCLREGVVSRVWGGLCDGGGQGLEELCVRERMVSRVWGRCV